MHVMVFFVAGLAGLILGWIAALLLRVGVPAPPHARPTRVGWATVGLGLAAVGAFLLAFTSGELLAPLRSDALEVVDVLGSPAGWSSAFAAAALFTGLLAAGRMGDRRWPTGIGLVLAGLVIVVWLVVMLSRVGEFLLVRQ